MNESSSKPPRRPSAASRVLRPAARGAEMIAGATGIDRAIEDVTEEAIVRAIRSPAVERALERLIAENVIEDAVGNALTSDQVAEAIIGALDSEVADRVWGEILAGNKAQMLVERIAEAPEIRAAIAQQGFGLVTDIGRRLTILTEALDDIAERVAHGVLRVGNPDGETDQVGLATRAVAAAIDLAILGLAFSVISGLLASSLPIAFGNLEGLPVLALVGIGLASFFAAGFAFVLAWALVGQTPGMRFLSIRLDADGTMEIGFRRATRRLFGVVLAAAPAGLGFLWILISPNRQGWHDKLAGTEVVYDLRAEVAPWATLDKDQPDRQALDHS